MNHPDHLPAVEETACAVCGNEVLENEYDRPFLRFFLRLHTGRVRLGRFHDDCRPAVFDAWTEEQRSGSDVR